MTADEFFTRCSEHDWTYNFSDDQGVWKRGEVERRNLISAAKADASLVPMWEAWLRWHGNVLAGRSNDRPLREDFIPRPSTFSDTPPLNSYRDGTDNPDQLTLV